MYRGYVYFLFVGMLWKFGMFDFVIWIGNNFSSIMIILGMKFEILILNIWNWKNKNLNLFFYVSNKFLFF